MSVKADFRGRGKGPILVAIALYLLALEALRLVSLGCVDSNPKHQRYYCMLGFNICGEIH